MSGFPEGLPDPGPFSFISKDSWDSKLVPVAKVKGNKNNLTTTNNGGLVKVSLIKI